MVASIFDIKNKFDNYEIDVRDLSIEQVIVLCEMYEQDIDRLETQIEDINTQIDIKKKIIRKQLDEMRELNNKRNLNANNNN